MALIQVPKERAAKLGQLTKELERVARFYFRDGTPYRRYVPLFKARLMLQMPTQAIMRMLYADELDGFRLPDGSVLINPVKLFAKAKRKYQRVAALAKGRFHKFAKTILKANTKGSAG